MMRKISNWGGFPTKNANWVALDKADTNGIQNNSAFIARGLGRCYGDSALSATIVSTEKLNKILDYDAAKGIVTCQAGVSFNELLNIFVPDGWFPPVTPGTKFITVGGAIASDIHGKNHHVAGTFCNHLLWMDILLEDNKLVRCSKEENSDLFKLTCGGMGLTGIIINASFKMEKIATAFIRQRTQKAKNLDEIMQLFESSASWSKSMAWIDCLAKGKKMGRSIMMMGETAKLDELNKTQHNKWPLQLHKPGKLSIPFYFPNFVLNTLSIKAFNFLYYNKHPNKILNTIVHYDKFYYPLDAILHWNRMYGKRGFTQYQFVLPKDKSYDGLKKIITLIQQKGMGSFLTVLKLFGYQPEQYLRFPKEGYTLAMDFPIERKLFPFLDELDKIVEAHEGRVYLTKDVRMKGDFLLRTYPEAAAFYEKLKHYNSGKVLSLQQERLQLLNKS